MGRSISTLCVKTLLIRPRRTLKPVAVNYDSNPALRRHNRLRWSPPNLQRPIPIAVVLISAREIDEGALNELFHATEAGRFGRMAGCRGPGTGRHRRRGAVTPPRFEVDARAAARRRLPGPFTADLHTSLTVFARRSAAGRRAARPRRRLRCLTRAGCDRRELTATKPRSNGSGPSAEAIAHRAPPSCRRPPPAGSRVSRRAMAAAPWSAPSREIPSLAVLSDGRCRMHPDDERRRCAAAVREDRRRLTADSSGEPTGYLTTSIRRAAGHARHRDDRAAHQAAERSFEQLHRPAPVPSSLGSPDDPREDRRRVRRGLSGATRRCRSTSR